MSLRVTFNPSTVRPEEQENIRELCVRAWEHPALKSSTEAIVYSTSGRWWHSNANDPTEHITVRYNRRANRVHIYRNGTVNVSPHKPFKADGYETVSELEDEEFED
ncbi:hypothetical protein VNI00_018147 [Paramarasmius palmivorus]|uniref:Uncharacterized protein n=1 Tax=Paramarasmius palmivorus TaxID=297713 RepID=A0AAW0B0P0_9AGAR